MKSILFLSFLEIFLLSACCRSNDESPLPFQIVHLNYSIEDGLWTYYPEDYFFILDDSTVFDDSTGILLIKTPHPLDANYLEITGTNCSSPIITATWTIDQLSPDQWRLSIQLPAATIACLQDQLLWGNDYWSFDFRLRVLPP
ncbi:MAG: hypothetical protein ABIQ93_06330 [Saprospiraceae bacterium]